MERDFLGLGSSEPSGVVKKEETSTEARGGSDAGLNKMDDMAFLESLGLNKVSGARWPFLEKFHAVPHLKLDLPGHGLVSTPNSGLLGAASTLGTTESSYCRNAAKPHGSPQLTIFYAGTVKVYDDIPPEKVQAIVILAGNRTSKSPKASHSKCYVHTPTTGNITGNHVVLTQPITQPCSGLSSPFSVAALPAPHLGSGLANKNGPKEGNTEGVTALSKVDSPKMVDAVRSIAATTMMSAAIPQSPKASLTRFLEKRKERLRNAAPYNLGKSLSLECASPDSSPMKLSSGPAMDKHCTQ